MKKIKLGFILSICLLFFYKGSFAQYIKLNGNQFIDENGTPFYPMVMSYYADLQRTTGSSSIVNTFVNRGSVFGNGKFVGTTQTDGIFNLKQDFTEMKNLGFNTVRIIMKPVKLINQRGFSVHTKDATAQIHMNVNILPNANNQYIPATNPELSAWFTRLQTILTAAQETGVKVIMPCGEDSEELIRGNVGSTATDDYKEYLKSVATFVTQLPTAVQRNILAYEFIGEPSLVTNACNGNPSCPPLHHTKTEICDISSLWISTIKNIDNNHLLTIGSYIGDPFTDGWDPQMMNVDFVNVHIYSQTSVQEFNVNPVLARQRCIKRYANLFYIFDNVIKKPYIVGETSFAGENRPGNPNMVFPIGCDGSEADMDDFVKKTFAMILQKSKASGYGWWILQNLNWYPDPPNPPTSSNPLLSLSQYQQNYLGILRYGIPSTSLTSGYAALRKTAAQNFMNPGSLPIYSDTYGPASPTYNVNDLYYNSFAYPDNLLVYTTSGGLVRRGKITGHVKDQNGNPIKFAIVDACNFDNVPNDAFHTYKTFTDENGYFEINAFDRDLAHNASDPNLDKTFDDIKIAAFGCSNTVERGWTGGPILGYEVFTLKSLQNKFDSSVPSGTVAIGTTQNYQANSTLTASNFIIDGDNNVNGGHSELKARNFVYLKPGFNAKKGSDVRIFTQPVSLSCSDVNALGRLASTDATEEIVAEDNKVVKELTIYPNPTTGAFTVILPASADETNNALIVLDILGREVYKISNIKNSVSIDLSSKQSGVYFIKFIQTNNCIQVKKITLD